MPAIDRRQFLQRSGAVLLPAILPVAAMAGQSTKQELPADEPPVNFFGDGADFKSSPVY